MSEKTPFRAQELLPVGRCPECGVVAGDDVEFNFPNTAKCAGCGSELSRCTTATAQEVRDHAELQ